MKRLEAGTVYLFIEFSTSAAFSMMFVVMSLYEATTAGLSPLQLVLVGTTVEASIFLFEVPTGVVADATSRRLSIISGYLLMGIGFMIEGLFPAFLPILLAQIFWGLGYTFTSGATQAWITDEIGEESANQLFLRATQLGLLASIFGMLAGSLIGAGEAGLPIRWGAGAILLMGLVLMLIMPETNFKPTPREDRNTWQHMWHIFNQGMQAVRARPRLVNILGVGLFYGLYSEGFDRLWVKHLLDTFDLPILFGSNQVAFLAVLRIGGTLLCIPVLRWIEKRVITNNPAAIGRIMTVLTAGISLAIIGFAFSPWLSLSAGLYLVVFVLRNMGFPLQTAWINQKLDSQVRATIHSMFGQVDAIGQIAGGPVIGLVARMLSVTTAISASGSLLLPALIYIRRTNKPGENEGDVRMAGAGDEQPAPDN